MGADLLVTGRDGKTYPARKLPRAELNRIRWLSHNLCHRDGLSQREAQRVMRESYGIRRSSGAIAADLVRFECPSCRELPGG